MSGRLPLHPQPHQPPTPGPGAATTSPPAPALLAKGLQVSRSSAPLYLYLVLCRCAESPLQGPGHPFGCQHQTRGQPGHGPRLAGAQYSRPGGKNRGGFPKGQASLPLGPLLPVVGPSRSSSSSCSPGLWPWSRVPVCPCACVGVCTSARVCSGHA